jgi:hypothetical protein
VFRRAAQALTQNQILLNTSCCSKPGSSQNGSERQGKFWNLKGGQQTGFLSPPEGETSNASPVGVVSQFHHSLA